VLHLKKIICFTSFVLNFISVFLPQQLNAFSLTEMTTKYFKQYKEYTSGITFNYPKNHVLTWEQFETTAKTFVTEHKKTALKKSESWMKGEAPPDDFFTFEKRYDYHHAYVQKKVIPSGSTVFFIGDFHGSLHSLLRILWHFVAAGYIDDTLKIIKDNCYIVFNGDLVDRGRYSIEVLDTVLQLKLKNWDTVFLLRGNHEEFVTSKKYGFIDELNAKYGGPKGEKHTFASKLFDFFPMALYLGSGKDAIAGNKPHFVQCCHGGIEMYEPKDFLDSDDKNIVFEKLPDDKYMGFNWSDFVQNATGGIIINNFVRGAGYIADVAATFKYLGTQNSSIKAFFRGHQDHTHVFKMFFGSNLGATVEKKIEDLKNIDATKLADVQAKEKLLETQSAKARGYPDGPYDWRDVFSPEDKTEMNANGFLIHKYVPVFTFTTATEARGLNFDSYGKLTTDNDYKQWRLMPYEFALDETRAGKYATLVYETTDADHHKHVSAVFTDAPPTNPIPEKLIALTKPSGEDMTNLIKALTQLKDNLKKLSARLLVK